MNSGPPSRDSTHLQVVRVAVAREQAAGALTVLGPIDFELAPRQVLSILGPSGAGKSAFIRVLAGLTAPTSGEVWIGGKRILLPETTVGLVFKDPALLEWRTVMENVLLQAEFRRLDNRSGANRARALLAAMNLSESENRRPREIPAGMRIATSICRALLHDPQLLLMDEPFESGDALAREQLCFDFQRLWMAEPRTMVLATTSIPEAVQLSDRILVLAARPGRPFPIIEIDLPRPRRQDKNTSPQLSEYANRVRTICQAQGFLH